MTYVFSVLIFSALSFAQTPAPTQAAGQTPRPSPSRNKTAPKEEKKMTKNPVVTMEVSLGPTALGSVDIELFEKEAPISVKNFLRYVDEGFYNNTIFHRVISNFMIQGGGFTADMKQKPTHEPIKNEATNGLKNENNTVAMARTGVVDSATAQFFINVKDNGFLDHRDTSNAGYGYAVFGKVISGADVVAKIKAVPTGSQGMFDDVPKTPVVIKSIHRKAL
jgi:cyclophilin family peptidyl-prolyl cis-trans isomerase